MQNINTMYLNMIVKCKLFLDFRRVNWSSSFPSRIFIWLRPTANSESAIKFRGIEISYGKKHHHQRDWIVFPIAASSFAAYLWLHTISLWRDINAIKGKLIIHSFIIRRVNLVSCQWSPLSAISTARTETITMRERRFISHRIASRNVELISWEKQLLSCLFRLFRILVFPRIEC